MSWFLAAAPVLQVALVPCAWVCWRFDSEHRVVALGLAGHAAARAIAVRRGATWSDPQDEATGAPGEER